MMMMMMKPPPLLPAAPAASTTSTTRSQRKRPSLSRAPLIIILVIVLVAVTQVLWSTELFHSDPPVLLPRYLGESPHDHRSLTPDLRSHLVDCNSLPKSLRDNDPNRGKPPIWVHITHSEALQPFYVSLHPQHFDKVRWDIYKQKRYYETKLEHAFTRVLSSAPPGIRVLDVGGNIGYYALYSAAFGKGISVDTFEPNPLNILRACEAVHRNGWSHEDTFRRGARRTSLHHQHDSDNPPAINLWQWGISNITGTLKFVENKNPGAGRIIQLGETVDTNRPNIVGAPVPLAVTTLDDFARLRRWIPVQQQQPQQQLQNARKPRIEILKIDVETHEANVLLGATALLKSQMIRHIFVEFARDSDRSLQTKALQALIDAGYTLCGWGKFQGPEHGKVPFPVHDHDNFIDNFFRHFVQTRGIALNMWWQLDAKCRVGSHA